MIDELIRQAEGGPGWVARSGEDQRVWAAALREVVKRARRQPHTPKLTYKDIALEVTKVLEEKVALRGAEGEQHGGLSASMTAQWLSKAQAKKAPRTPANAAQANGLVRGLERLGAWTGIDEKKREREMWALVTGLGYYYEAEGSGHFLDRLTENDIVVVTSAVAHRSDLQIWQEGDDQRRWQDALERGTRWLVVTPSSEHRSDMVSETMFGYVEAAVRAGPTKDVPRRLELLEHQVRFAILGKEIAQRDKFCYETLRVVMALRKSAQRAGEDWYLPVSITACDAVWGFKKEDAVSAIGEAREEAFLNVLEAGRAEIMEWLVTCLNQAKFRQTRSRLTGKEFSDHVEDLKLFVESKYQPVALRSRPEENPR